MKNYDAIIIGAGQGGVPLSKKLAKYGWKTALIEKDLIGGTCVNVGCTPTKTMIASAKRLYDCRKADKLGVVTSGANIDIKKVLARKNKIVESFRKGAEKGLEKTKNLHIIYGTAIFTGKKKIKIALKEGGTEQITANKIFIDVGARPSLPEIPGLKKVDYLTSTSIMELEEVPKHLLIIGAGYIGLEFGQMYRRFGSEVTLLEGGKQFLSNEDEDIATCIRDFLEKEKIEIMTAAKVIDLQKTKEGISATIKTRKEETRCFSHVLIATGRTPNTDKLGVKAGGIKLTEKDFIEVNAQLETSVKGVYALGDVKGGPEFTHIAYNDHLVIYKNVTEGRDISFHDRLVPYTMFTDPQLGRVGITEEEARKQKIKFQVATFSMDNVARAIETGDTRGMMKAIVDSQTGQILGAAIIGEQGGEIMSVLQMAMVGNITWQTIRELPIAHPLYAESLNNLFMQLEKK